MSEMDELQVGALTDAESLPAAAATPGPWLAVPKYGGDSTCRIESDAARIAEMCSNSPEGNANARLIAASPELLWCLKQILDDLPSNRDWL